MLAVTGVVELEDRGWEAGDSGCLPLLAVFINLVTG